MVRPPVGDPGLLRETGNSYDNSIRYTDWFLAQVIGLLKQGGQRAVLVYVADHGELLRDASCSLSMHGHGTDHEYHVPALVWFADQYRARYPAKVAALQRQRAARLGTTDMFHTVLDLADIRYPGERLEWSFVHPGYTPRRRMVASDNWVDFDTAERKGACRRLFRPAGMEKAG
jgi:arylsulfatase A-like enzyme